MNKELLFDGNMQRRVFWLLRRLTSYSLWERKRDAWKIFADAYEDAVKTWPASQSEQMPADNLPAIYNILSLYNEGLQALRNGDRSVWRNDGVLNMAVSQYYGVASFLYPDADYWERGAQQAPYPAKVEALNQLMRASEFHGDAAPLESKRRESAFIAGPGFLLNPRSYEYGFHSLAYPIFPEVLPEIPEGEDVLIRSGQTVPVSGIWEPVHVERDRILGLIPHGSVRIESAGCFNYFVNGTAAPKIIGRYIEATERFERVNVQWRLLWEDRRYKDGVVPDESEYFLLPKLSPSQSDGDIEAVRAYDVCPVSGWWEAVGYRESSRHISAGDVMPDFSVRDAKGEMISHLVTWRILSRD
jgi:hypothetical protein